MPDTSATTVRKLHAVLWIWASRLPTISSSTRVSRCAGVQNLLNAYQQDFDRGANRDSGYIYGPGMSRSIYAGLKLSY